MEKNSAGTPLCAWPRSNRRSVQDNVWPPVQRKYRVRLRDRDCKIFKDLEELSNLNFSKNNFYFIWKWRNKNIRKMQIYEDLQGLYPLFVAIKVKQQSPPERDRRRRCKSPSKLLDRESWRDKKRKIQSRLDFWPVDRFECSAGQVMARVTTRVICLRNFTGSARGGFGAGLRLCPCTRFVRTNARGGALRVCACKSQREVVTTGSPVDTHVLAPGSPTRALR